jgi:hypothetical protein
MGAAPGEQWIFQYHPQNGRQLCTEEANLKDIEESLDNVASAISSGWKSLGGGGGNGQAAKEAHASHSEMECSLLMPSGGLGLCISESVDPLYRVQFGCFTGSSDAENMVTPKGKLVPRMVLTHINGEDQAGKLYEDVKAGLKVQETLPSLFILVCFAFCSPFRIYCFFALDIT